MRLLKPLTIFMLLIFLVSAASAACPKEKSKDAGCRTGCNYQPVKTCSKNTVSSCSKNACNTGKACNYGQWKKSKCRYPPKNGCRVGCGKNKTVPPVVTPPSNDTEVPQDPGDQTGISKVTLCRSGTCTVDGEGKVITLTNYASAKNPTYDQLIAFAEADKTDEKPYSSKYTCSSYARDFHDACEAAGIRAGWTASRKCNHAWNVFDTTDRGIVYIDCTGQPSGGTLLDKELTVKQGQPLTGTYLFRGGQTVSMGCDPGQLLTYW